MPIYIRPEDVIKTAAFIETGKRLTSNENRAGQVGRYQMNPQYAILMAQRETENFQTALKGLGINLTVGPLVVDTYERIAVNPNTALPADMDELMWLLWSVAAIWAKEYRVIGNMNIDGEYDSRRIILGNILHELAARMDDELFDVLCTFKELKGTPHKYEVEDFNNAHTDIYNKWKNITIDGRNGVQWYLNEVATYNHGMGYTLQRGIDGHLGKVVDGTKAVYTDIQPEDKSDWVIDVNEFYRYVIKRIDALNASVGFFDSPNPGRTFMKNALNQINDPEAINRIMREPEGTDLTDSPSPQVSRGQTTVFKYNKKLDRMHAASPGLVKSQIADDEDVFRIGDLEFVVPPTAIRYNATGQTYGFDSMRTDGNPIVPVSTQRPSINITLYINGKTAINEQLRPLVAMAKRAPFTQVKSKIISKLLIDRAISAEFNKDEVVPAIFPIPIVIDSISFHTVPGYPDSIQLYLTIRFFNFFPYGEMRGYEATSNPRRQEMISNNKIYDVLHRSRAYSPVSAKSGIFATQTGELITLKEPAGVQLYTTDDLGQSPEFIRFYRSQLLEFEDPIMVSKNSRWDTYNPDGAGGVTMIYNQITNLDTPATRVLNFIKSARLDLDAMLDNLKLLQQFSPSSDLRKGLEAKPGIQYIPLDIFEAAASTITGLRRLVTEANNLYKATAKEVFPDSSIRGELQGATDMFDNLQTVWINNPLAHTIAPQTSTMKDLSIMLGAELPTDTSDGSLGILSNLINSLETRFTKTADSEVGKLELKSKTYVFASSTSDMAPTTDKTVIQSVSVSYTNKLVPIDITQYNTPTYQHMGMGQFNVSMALHTNDFNFIERLNDIRLTQTGVAMQAAYATMISLGTDRVEFNDPMLQAIGATEFTVRNVVIKTLPGTTGWYAVELDMIHNPNTIDQQEKLRTVGGASIKYVKKVAPDFFPTNLVFDKYTAKLIMAKLKIDPNRTLAPKAKPGIFVDRDYLKSDFQLMINKYFREDLAYSVDFDTLLAVSPDLSANAIFASGLLNDIVTPTRDQIYAWRKAVVSDLGDSDTLNATNLTQLIERSTYQYMQYVYQAASLFLGTLLPNVFQKSDIPTSISLTDSNVHGISIAAAYSLQEHSREFMRILFVRADFNRAMKNLAKKGFTGWRGYLPNYYAKWIENNSKLVRNNYTDFSFPEDLMASVHEDDGKEVDPQPQDFHKILHPAWYFAATRIPPALLDAKIFNDHSRLELALNMSNLINNEDLDSLAGAAEVVKDMYRAELGKATSGLAKYEDSAFYEALRNGAVDRKGVSTGNPAMLVNISTLDMFKEMKEDENMAKLLADRSGEYLQFQKEQMLRYFLAVHLLQYFFLAALLNQATQVEGEVENDVTVLNRGKVLVEGVTLGNDMPGLKVLFPAINNMGNPNSEGVRSAVDKILNNRSFKDKTHVTTVLGKMINDIGEVIVRAGDTRSIDTALAGFGYTDIDAELLNVSLDKKLASQVHNNWDNHFIQAFPAFKMFLIEEDSTDWGLFDDFYTYDGIQSIDVIDSKHSASSTAIIRLSNVTGKLTSPGISQLFRDTDDPKNLERFRIQPGTTVMVRLGYGPDYRNLPVVMYGAVTEVIPGPILEIKIQSFGVELLSEMSRSITSGSMESHIGEAVLTTLSETSGLKHFGRWSIHHGKSEEFIAASNDLTKHLYTLGRIAGLSGTGVSDVDSGLLDKVKKKVVGGSAASQDVLGLYDGDVGAGTKDFVDSLIDGTNQYAMLLNFGNSLYDNIYVNNKRPQYYGFVNMVPFFNRFDDKDSFYWHINNQTTWDALWEQALYLGDYIVRPLPYNEGAYLFGGTAPRATLYFGPRDGQYKASDDPYHITGKGDEFATAIRQRILQTEEELTNSNQEDWELDPLTGLNNLEQDMQDAARKLGNAALWASKFNPVKSRFDNLFNDYYSPPLKQAAERLSNAGLPHLAQFALKYASKIMEEESFTSKTHPVSVFTQLLCWNMGDIKGNIIPQFYSALDETLSGPVTLTDRFLAGNRARRLVIFTAVKAEWAIALRADMPQFLANIKSNNYQVTGTKSQHLEDLIQLLDDDGQTGSESYQPIVEHHFASSDSHIISNEITVTEDLLSNKVSVYYPTSVKDSGVSAPHEWDKENKVISSISNELDANYIREYVSFQKNCDTSIFYDFTGLNTLGEDFVDATAGWKHAQPQAKMLADQILMNQIKPMYQGSLVLRGDATIRPWHYIHISDAVSQMSGVIEVEEVIHSMSSSGGFITTIKPNLVTSMRNTAAAIDTELMGLNATLNGLTRKVGTAWTVLKVGGELAGAKYAVKTSFKWLVEKGIASELGKRAVSFLTAFTSMFVIVGTTIAAGGIKYKTMEMKQFINAANMQLGNAPIIMSLLQYNGKAYSAGLEGIQYNRNASTIAISDIIDANYWDGIVTQWGLMNGEIGL